MRSSGTKRGLGVVNLGFKRNAVEEPMFNDRFFPNIKQVSYQKSTKRCSGTRFIKRVKSLNKGMDMSDLDIKGVIYSFNLRITLFSNSYYGVNPSNRASSMISRTSRVILGEST